MFFPLLIYIYANKKRKPGQPSQTRQSDLAFVWTQMMNSNSNSAAQDPTNWVDVLEGILRKPRVSAHFSGGSRFSQGGSCKDFGAKTYYLARFLPKLYEDERNWTGGRGAMHLSQILQPNLSIQAIGRLVTEPPINEPWLCALLPSNHRVVCRRPLRGAAWWCSAESPGTAVVLASNLQVRICC